SGVIDAFKAGALARNCVVVVRYQGPRANGMPELHQLTPTLSSLQSKGFQVALVTDGRMSGASGAVPAAIHMTPECIAGGMLQRVQSGDVIKLDSYAGTLEVRVADDVLRNRPVAPPDLRANGHGVGRELFETFRRAASDAESGAVSIWDPHLR
ncbi:MAG: dihydroxy-acid dehydratase, partial [Steroidobacteraceae bacterium]